jgi:CheY-like chemotaxis protein
MSRPPPGSAPAPLVLIVDDVEDTVLIYASFLEYRGFRTATAGTAKKALEIATEQRPAVIVMDYALPGTDGLSAARQLATDPGTAHIPLIMLTGHIETVRPDTVKAAGARSFITKPCLPDILE